MRKIICTLLFAIVILGTPYQALAQAFITEWITNNGNITIPTTGTGYNYNVSYRQILPTIGATTTLTGQTGNCTITGLTNGNTYEVSITGTFPRIFFSGSAAERPKIRNIRQWGSIAWSSMNGAFTGCVNLNSNATDAPNLSGVTDMTAMFQGCTIFNGDIGSWNTSTITTMNNTFRIATTFNQNIGTWNTGNVTNMSAMFLGATAFDQNIGTWNTGNVTDMSFMFNNATAFNQNIGTVTWNTANVANMRDMFNGATAFNQNIGTWNTSNVTNMRAMFSGATAFNQNLGTWNVANLNAGSFTGADEMLNNCGMNTANYDATLIGWASQNVKTGVLLGAIGRTYSCAGEPARTTLASAPKSWVITGDNSICTPFITEWITTTGDITIPTTGTGYNYNVSYRQILPTVGGTTTLTGQTGNCTITGLINGNTYEVSITGNFPRIFFNGGAAERPKIRNIKQWGNIAWSSMSGAFTGCVNLNSNATDAPNLSGVTNMTSMFGGCTIFNGSNMSAWNTSTVTTMSNMFILATAFNQNISTWNTSNVTNMLSMFENATAFNQNIGTWNTGNVINMPLMFRGAIAFNQPIGTWNTSNVTVMRSMFEGATAFNQNISTWNTSNVTSMRSMFEGATAFNQNLDTWNTSNVINMRAMFSGATAFNQNLGTWNVTNLDAGGSTGATFMLNNCGMNTANYDATLIGWASQNVKTGVFLGAIGRTYSCAGEPARTTLASAPKSWVITGDNSICTPFITEWITTNGNITIPTTGGGYNYNVSYRQILPTVGATTTLTGQTGNCTITGLINGNTYEVSITGTFPRIYFNAAAESSKIRNIKQWGNIAWTSMANAFQGCDNLNSNATDAPNLSGVTDMTAMFGGCTIFNGTNMSAWNTSSVTDMNNMFVLATAFNQNISTWNTGNVTNMTFMFSGATAFNQNIGTWNTGNVTDMFGMFEGATAFNQNLGTWNVTNLNAGSFTGADEMLNNCGMNTANYDATLIGWASQNVKTGVFLGATGLTYCAGATARTTLASAPKNWTITGDALSCTPFITEWITTTGNITIPTVSAGYNYNVSYRQILPTIGATTTLTGQTGNVTITGLINGNTYEVSITGTFPRIVFSNGAESPKIRNIKQWGNIAWTSMNSAFAGCVNLNSNATDAPNLSGVTDMNGMFSNCTIFNGTNMSAWNTSSVTNMQGMFLNAPAFNQNIGTWNTGNVTNMIGMFRDATAFNQNIGGWATNNVTDMSSMFQGATAFNQPIGTWNTGNVTNMRDMFNGATAFNGNISNWSVGNVINMSAMFLNATAFNQPIGIWNTGNVTNMSAMFFNATAFNQPIGTWTTTNVTNMSSMFQGATTFNQPINTWNTANVANINSMFRSATNFNSNISTWNTSNVTNMGFLFAFAPAFNQNISAWNTSNVTNMENMFANATAFNQNIDTWNTGNVTNMSSMFSGATAFNQNIGTWNTSNVTNMGFMFFSATAFNQNIGTWNTIAVTNMNFMFFGATAFNQSLASWNVTNLDAGGSTGAEFMLDNCGMNTANYDATLIGWASQNVKTGVSLGANGLTYCAGATARATLASAPKNWTITGDALSCPTTITLSTNAINDFISVVSSSSVSQSFTVSATGLTANVILALSTTDWELSTNNSSFSNTLNLVQSGGTLAGQPITVYVRLKTGLSIGNLTATLTASSTGATNQTIALSGKVLNAIPSTGRGNMISFDGTNDNISIPHDANLNISTNQLTLSAWIKRNTTNTFDNLIMKGSYGYGLVIDDNNRLGYWSESNYANCFNSGSNTIPVNVWTHVAVVVNAGVSTTLYINGTNVGTSTALTQTVINNNTGTLAFGVEDISVCNCNLLEGNIDEMQIWNTARTQNQIRENMHLTLSGAEAGLVAYYQFNETAGNAIDAIRGNNGTLNNGISRIDSEVAVAKGTFVRMNVSNGLNTFTAANVAINFTTAPADEFVAYQLRETPYNGMGASMNTASCYWIVRQFGTNAVAYNTMNFTIPNNNIISGIDEITPNNIKLYKRGDVQTIAFGAPIAGATSANNTTKIIQFTTLVQTSFSQFKVGSIGSPLPITLLSFEGKRVDESNVLLEWKTATEFNNKGFDVEKSKNGMLFTKIAFVNGAGNSNTIKNYQLSIVNSQDGYYRLKQINFDSTFSYFNIISVKGNENIVSIYPNPTTENINIKTSKEGFVYEIFTLQGNSLIKNNETGNVANVNIKSFSKGLYFVHIIQNNNRVVKKIVVE